MRKMFVYVVLIICSLFIVKVSYAYSCIPNSFNRKIVIATLDKVEFQCAVQQDNMRTVHLLFTTDKKIYGDIDQQFKIEAAYFSKNTSETCSSLQNNPPYTIPVFGDINEGIYPVTEDSMYILKINELLNNPFHYLSSCNGVAITEVKSINDPRAYQMRSALIQEYVSDLLMIIPNFFSILLSLLSLPKLIILSLSFVLTIGIYGFLLFIILNLIKLIFIKVKSVFNKK